MRPDLAAARVRWRGLTGYQKFEHAVVLFLTGLIAIVIVAAVWNLTLKILFSLVLSGKFDPTEHAVFQGVFGMIFTVIIALEFKRSLLIITERADSVVQVRTVVLLAMLAILRKLIILDLGETEATQIFALAAAILALGAVYWFVRDQDRRDAARRTSRAD
ncbi:MAG: protein PsiE [Candidatus Rokuibacteriota bacterium]|nr:MAG: protein PsiE [Candidatus Rokubacteria bacterium]